MVGLMGLGVALTMPFHGALIRLRANYNPKAIGLEGAENRWVRRLPTSHRIAHPVMHVYLVLDRVADLAVPVRYRVGPTLTSLFGTLRRVKRLEGWYGLYKGLLAPRIANGLCLILAQPADVDDHSPQDRTPCWRSPPSSRSRLSSLSEGRRPAEQGARTLSQSLAGCSESECSVLSHIKQQGAGQGDCSG